MTARGTGVGPIGARTFTPMPSSATGGAACRSAMNCTIGLSMSARRPAWVERAWKSTGAKGADAKNTGGRRRLRLLGDDFKVAADMAHEWYPQHGVVHDARHAVTQGPSGKQAR